MSEGSAEGVSPAPGATKARGPRTTVKRPEGLQSNETGTRPEVLRTVKNVYTRMEQSAKVVVAEGIIQKLKTNQSLSPDEERALASLPLKERALVSDFHIVSEGKRLTIDQGQEGFTTEFTTPDGENHTVREGMPVEGLIAFIDSEMAPLEAKVNSQTPLTKQEQKQYESLKKEKHVLVANSTPYKNTPLRQGPPVPGSENHAYHELEANRISIDPLRKTPSAEGDWYDAEATLDKRRVLNLPAEKAKATAIAALPASERVIVSAAPDLFVVNPANPNALILRPGEPVVEPPLPSNAVILLGPAGSTRRDIIPLGPRGSTRQELIPVNPQQPPIIEIKLPPPPEPRMEFPQLEGRPQYPQLPPAPDAQPTPPSTDDQPIPLGPRTDIPKQPDEGVKPEKRPDGITPAPRPEPKPEEEKPADQPKPETPSQIRRKQIVIANRMVDIRRRAAEMAEEQLRAEAKGKKWYDIVGRVKTRLFEEGYRQRYRERAIATMLAEDNSFLTMDLVRNAAINATNRTAYESSAAATVSRVAEGGLIAGENVITVSDGPLKTLLTTNIMEPYMRDLQDRTLNREAVRQRHLQRLRDTVSNNINNADTSISDPLNEIFGRGATEYGLVADAFADGLEATAREIFREQGVQNYAVEQLDKMIDYKLANTKWAAATDAHFNSIDRAISWMQSNRFRALTAPLANSVFMGFASSIGAAVTLRAVNTGAKSMQWMVPGAGTLVGATVAAIDRNRNLKIDMAAHRVDRAYGGQTAAGSKERERLDRFQYSTAKVTDLLNGNAATGRAGVREILDRVGANPLTDPTQRMALADVTAEILTRLDMADQHVDSIIFEGREQVEQGRLELVRAVAAARLKLADDSLIDNLRPTWKHRLREDVRLTDEQFARERRSQAIKAGLKAAIVSGAVAEGLQWVGKAAAYYAPGVKEIPIVGGIVGGLVQKGQTLGERFALHPLAEKFGHPDWFAAPASLEDFKNAANGGTIDIGALHGQVDATDHALHLFDQANNPVKADGLFINPDGHLVAQHGLPTELQAATQGWNHADTLTHSIKQEVLDKVAQADQLKQAVPVKWGDLSGTISHDSLHNSFSLTDSSGLKFDGSIAPDGTLSLASTDKHLMEVAYAKLKDAGFAVPNQLVESQLTVPGNPNGGTVIERIQETLAKHGKVDEVIDNLHITADPATGKVVIESAAGHVPIQFGTKIIHVEGTLDPRTGELVFNHNLNERNLKTDFAALQAELQRIPGVHGALTVSTEHIPAGGSTVDQLLQQPADVLRAQGIINTSDSHKSWNFHTLWPEHVVATGEHAGRELEAHLHQYVGADGAWHKEPGAFQFSGTLDTNPVNPHLPGLQPRLDPALNEIIGRNGPLTSKDMFAEVGLVNGGQLMLPLGEQGVVHLPQELYDVTQIDNPQTRGLVGVDEMAAVVMVKPDGTLLRPSELLAGAKIPEGTVIHSLASEKWTPVMPPAAQPVDVLKVRINADVIPPPEPKVITNYLFDAKPPLAQEFTPPDVGVPIPPAFTPSNRLHLEDLKGPNDKATDDKPKTPQPGEDLQAKVPAGQDRKKDGMTIVDRAKQGFKDGMQQAHDDVDRAMGKKKEDDKKPAAGEAQADASKPRSINLGELMNELSKETADGKPGRLGQEVKLTDQQLTDLAEVFQAATAKKMEEVPQLKTLNDILNRYADKTSPDYDKNFEDTLRGGNLIVVDDSVTEPTVRKSANGQVRLAIPADVNEAWKLISNMNTTAIQLLIYRDSIKQGVTPRVSQSLAFMAREMLPYAQDLLTSNQKSNPSTGSSAPASASAASSTPAASTTPAH